MRDGGARPRTSTTVLTINIDQNLYTPEFSTTGGPCGADISEDSLSGAVVTTVTASDNDVKVLFSTCFFLIQSLSIAFILF